MPEAEVLEKPSVADAIDFEAENERAFGEPKDVETIVEKNKVKKKTEAKVETPAKPGTNIEASQPEVIETKVEEKKPEAKKPSDKKEKFYDPFEKKTEVRLDDKGKPVVEPAATIPAKTKEDLERDQKFEGYKTKATEYEQFVESDNIIKTLIEGKKAGKSTLEALMEIQPKDYSQLGKPDSKGEYSNDETLAKEYYTTIVGLKDADLQSAVDEFKEDGESASKKKLRRDWIKELDYAQVQNLQKFTENVNSSKEQKKQNNAKFHGDIDDFVNKIKKSGQLYGMQLPADEIPGFGDDMHNFFADLFNEDGTVNIEPIVQAKFFKKFNKKRLKEVADNAESDGNLEVLERVHNPDPNNESIQNRKPQAEVEDGEKLNEKYYGEGAVKPKN